MPRVAFRLLPLVLALLSFCSMVVLAQNGDGGYGTYGTYGGGNETTNAPAPQQPNMTQPTPPPPPPPPQPNVTPPTPPPPPPLQPNVSQPRPTPPAPQQPNVTRPTPPAAGGNATRPTATTTSAATGDAIAALPITLSNNNSWTHAETGDAYEQNNYLLTNTGNRPICDVSIKAPLANSNNTRIYSSYNVQVLNTTGREMHFDLPFYLHKIWPGQVVSFGFILYQSGNNGTATGGMANVTHARYCDHDDGGDGGNDSNNHRLRRRRVLVRTDGWA